MEKKTKISLIVVLAALLLSMIGSFIVQTNFFSVKQIEVTCSMEDLVKDINDNVVEYNKFGGDIKTTLSKASDEQISLAVYKPKNATESNKVPAIIGAHGWNNSKETQLQNFVELAKRGFVVVVVDLAGHGHSDMVSDESGWKKGNTEGCLAAVEYAMSLPYVDETQIGTVGHSAGDLGIAYAIEQINIAGSKKHIAAFCCAAGAIGAMIMNFNATLDKSHFLIDVQIGKYEELSDWGFDLNKSPLPKMIFNGFSGNALGATDTIPENVYYADGIAVATPEPGKKLSVDHGIIMRAPKVTHPGAVFSCEVESNTIDFFYASFGTPQGSKYIKSTSQTWWVGTIFQLIGLLAFFASAIVFGSVLLGRKRFQPLLLSPVPEGDALPVITSWKEYVPMIVTFIPLAILGFLLYFPLFDKGQVLIKSNNITPVVSGVVWYTFITGVFAFIMIGVNYIAMKLCHLKDKEKVESLLVTGKVETVSKFMNQILLAVEVVLFMYIPCVIGYYVFGMNFGISVYAVGVPRLIWLPEVLSKYLPFYLVFTISNAMLNARCRFRKVPEWASTGIVILLSLIPIVLLLIINYAAFVSTGLPAKNMEGGDPAIWAWNLLAPMIFVGIVNRYYYKKTGNIWTGAIITALVLVLMATTVTRHTADAAFFF